MQSSPREVVAYEWVLTADGRWQPVDPAAERTAIAAGIGKRLELNRAVIHANGAWCAAVRAHAQWHARAHRAWLSLPLAAATRH